MHGEADSCLFFWLELGAKRRVKIMQTCIRLRLRASHGKEERKSTVKRWVSQANVNEW